MMNNHSTRRALAMVAMALLTTGCGGGSDESGASTRAEWQDKYASAVSVVSDDIDRSVQALNAGQRPVLLSECTQLMEDLADARKAVPAPNPAVDDALRAAFDAAGTAVGTCVEGARVASDASIVE